MSTLTTSQQDAVASFNTASLGHWMHRILYTRAEDLGQLDAHSLRLLARNALSYQDRLREKSNLFQAELSRRSQQQLDKADANDVPRVLTDEAEWPRALRAASP